MSAALMQGVPVADPEGAFLWFQHAYDKRGSESAAYHLGRCHFLGVGTVYLANACSSIHTERAPDSPCSIPTRDQQVLAADVPRSRHGRLAWSPDIVVSQVRDEAKAAAILGERVWELGKSREAQHEDDYCRKRA